MLSLLTTRARPGAAGLAEARRRSGSRLRPRWAAAAAAALVALTAVVAPGAGSDCSHGYFRLVSSARTVSRVSRRPRRPRRLAGSLARAAGCGGASDNSSRRDISARGERATFRLIIRALAVGGGPTGHHRDSWRSRPLSLSRSYSRARSLFARASPFAIASVPPAPRATPALGDARTDTGCSAAPALWRASRGTCQQLAPAGDSPSPSVFRSARNPGSEVSSLRRAMLVHSSASTQHKAYFHPCRCRTSRTRRHARDSSQEHPRDR